MPRKNTYITATDQFCGAGGSTTGAKSAGVEVKMALNHWDLAIQTHNTNHPEVDHDCTDVQACDPRRYPSTDILITSPECTNHSLAKGVRRRHRNQLDIFGAHGIHPEHERSRATMWDVPRFAEYHDYNAIIVENVVDARYWTMWDAWLMAMHSLGYEHKCVYLNSMFFHPCPQSRDRMYVIFTKKNNKRPDLNFRPIAPCQHCGDKEAYQSWKRAEKKWGKYKKQYVYRCSSCNNEVTPYYYCALNAIDWTEPITRIGDRKRPLAEKTMKRIQYGLDKYGGRQMIITGRYTSGINCRVKPADEHPLPTQPGDQSHFLLSQVYVGSTSYSLEAKTAEKPLNTQTTRQDQFLLVSPPGIVELRNTSTSRDSPGLLLSGHNPGWVRTLDKPLGTFTTTTPQALLTNEQLSSFLTYYYGSDNASHCTAPVNTVTTIDRAALNIPDIRIEDCYYRCLKAHEVQRAMAFPDEYIVLGDVKQKVKQLGNAVTPPAIQWLCERVVESLN